MEFEVKTGHPEKQRTACIVVPIFEAKHLSNTVERLDKVSDGYLSKIINKGDIKGKVGQTLLLHHVPNLLCDRVLLVGCGKESELNCRDFSKIVTASINALKETGVTEASYFISECKVKDQDLQWKLKLAVLNIENVLYKFDAFKSKKDPKSALRRITFNVASKKELKVAEQALLEATAISKGVSYTKDLANTPANVCNPSYLAKEAKKLSKKYKKVNCAILEKKDMQALGMGAFLAVSQGSNQAPKLITIEYAGAKKKNEAPIVLVGKGITFDTGGNSLKPSAAMIGMKYDMSGAATVLGTMLFAAEMQLPINLVGVLAAAENMPGPNASRPDDVVTSMSGLTIEIANTDAEGRLVLCDTLTYCERYKPKAVIDIATLTGACVVALGRHQAGMYSNDPDLATALENASNMSSDKCWQMPLGEEYQQQLDSNVADVCNLGGPEAGSITAACFLARFTKKYPWSHLDIAGVASTKDRLATGRPVSLLAQYLLNCT